MYIIKENENVLGYVRKKADVKYILSILEQHNKDKKYKYTSEKIFNLLGEEKEKKDNE